MHTFTDSLNSCTCGGNSFSVKTVYGPVIENNCVGCGKKKRSFWRGISQEDNDYLIQLALANTKETNRILSDHLSEIKE
jgi:hypothetical protein